MSKKIRLPILVSNFQEYLNQHTNAQEALDELANDYEDAAYIAREVANMMNLNPSIKITCDDDIAYVQTPNQRILKEIKLLIKE